MAITTGRGAHIVFQQSPATPFASVPGTVDAVRLGIQTGVAIRDGSSPRASADLDTTVLPRQSSCVDPDWQGDLPFSDDLNLVGYLLCWLFGGPITVADGGNYKHTWELALRKPDAALVELVYADPLLARRWLGCFISSLAWGVKQGEGFRANMLAAKSADPQPAAPWDTVSGALDVLPESKVCDRRGEIANTLGTNTLGKITDSSIEITRDISLINVADGTLGAGGIDYGGFNITGSARYYFNDGMLDQIRLDRDLTRLVLVKTSEEPDHQLKLVLPKVEFDPPAFEVPTATGVVQSAGWRAVEVNGAGLPTVELINGVDAYTWS
jgi:hypothetical protein